MPAAMGDMGADGIPNWAGNIDTGTNKVSSARTLVDLSFGTTYNWRAKWVPKPENWYSSMRDRLFNFMKPVTVPAQTANNINTQSGMQTVLDAAPTLLIPGRGVGAGDLSLKVVYLTAATVNIGDPAGKITVGGAGSGAIILADGSVNINGPIEPGDLNSGFLAILAKGNITFSSNIGQVPQGAPVGDGLRNDIAPDSYPADVTGVFYAQGQLSTGDGAIPATSPTQYRQLKIEGSIAAAGLDTSGNLLPGIQAVQLQRGSEGPYPAEFVKFNPRFATIMMEIGLRRKVQYEQLIP
jgi:hypothetical protein